MKRSLRVVSLLQMVQKEIDHCLSQGYTWNRTRMILTSPSGDEIWYREIQEIADAYKLAGASFSYITYSWYPDTMVSASIPNYLSTLIKEPAHAPV